MRILVKDSSILNFLDFDESGFSMYPDSAARRAGNAEYHIYPDEFSLFNILAQNLSPDSLLRFV
ncbi:MAG: hypothetical protein R3B47_04005 [Bacteroidia bacterium]